MGTGAFVAGVSAVVLPATPAHAWENCNGGGSTYWLCLDIRADSPDGHYFQVRINPIAMTNVRFWGFTTVTGPNKYIISGPQQQFSCGAGSSQMTPWGCGQVLAFSGTKPGGSGQYCGHIYRWDGANFVEDATPACQGW